MQPTPVLSLGSDHWSRSLSSQPLHPGGWADKTFRLVSTGWHLSSVRESLRFALCTPVAALSSVAPKLPPDPPLSLPVKGLPSVWKLFLLHSSLPEVQVPSLFFCLCFFFFFCPTQVRGDFLAFGKSVVFCQCSVGRSCSTCRCIFDVFVGRKVISTSYSSAILKVPLL